MQDRLKRMRALLSFFFGLVVGPPGEQDFISCSVLAAGAARHLRHDLPGLLVNLTVPLHLLAGLNNEGLAEKYGRRDHGSPDRRVTPALRGRFLAPKRQQRV